MPGSFSRSEGRKFGLQVGVAFLVLAGLLWWRERNLPATILAGMGGLLLVAGVVIPTRLGPVFHGWMGFARAISKVTTPLFMGIAYFVVLAPIGLTMRLFGHNPMMPAEKDGTFWINRRDDESRRGDLTRQF